MQYTPDAKIQWLGFEDAVFELKSAAVGVQELYITQQPTLISIASNDEIANNNMQYTSDAKLQWLTNVWGGRMRR